MGSARQCLPRGVGIIGKEERTSPSKRSGGGGMGGSVAPRRRTIARKADESREQYGLDFISLRASRDSAE